MLSYKPGSPTDSALLNPSDGDERDGGRRKRRGGRGGEARANNRGPSIAGPGAPRPRASSLRQPPGSDARPSGRETIGARVGATIEPERSGETISSTRRGSERTPAAAA